MTTRAQLIEDLQRGGNPNDELAVAVFCAGDVDSVCESEGLFLSDEEVDFVLQEMERRQDCTTGFGWHTMYDAIGNLFPNVDKIPEGFDDLAHVLAHHEERLTSECKG